MQISLWKVFIIYAYVLVKAMLFFVCKFDHLLIAKACKNKLRKFVFKREEDQSKQMYRTRKPVEHDYQPNGGNSSILHLRQSWHGFLSFVWRFFSKSFFLSSFNVFLCFHLTHLQIVLCERAPTPGSFKLASAFPTSHCVTPSLIRRCLKRSAKASNSLEKLSVDAGQTNDF